ncbi:MAG: phytanoyl-CoA dioxygenase family protein [Armatimonadota bacterium]|nr:phytanoyl-CoA dioxygenase family protein [Armatimonadota bacterium]
MMATDSAWNTVDHASADEVRFYREQGYLKFGRIFTAEEMDNLRLHVDDMIAQLPEGKRPESLDVPHFSDPWLFRYLAHPKVLDVIEDFIGPDIVLWSSHFIAKPKGDGRAVPWHTDGAYWGSMLQPMNVITLWLAVDPSTRTNGCMRVIPASHRGAPVGMDQYEGVDTTQNVFHVEIKRELMDEDKAVDLELAVGECHFHDAWTLHSSIPNTSSQRRCGYTMRYMPADVHFVGDAAWQNKHRIYLLRGEDRTGGRNGYEPIPKP